MQSTSKNYCSICQNVIDGDTFVEYKKCCNKYACRECFRESIKKQGDVCPCCKKSYPKYPMVFIEEIKFTKKDFC